MRSPTQFRTLTALILLAATAGIALGQGLFSFREEPEGEFHLARMIYSTSGFGGSFGFRQPWWAIDYPQAEEHFLPALHRVTGIDVAADSRHIQVTDPDIFKYPFLFIQQAGRGYWDPSDTEAAALREYLYRGGFLMVDDFHGVGDWRIVERALTRVLPDHAIVEIPDDDQLMHVFYDLDKSTQIPGDRHVFRCGGGPGGVRMEGPATWLGIYDELGRLMVAINYNMDMGDAWEHADDPCYPGPMTALSYRFGVNYVVYAMTH